MNDNKEESLIWLFAYNYYPPFPEKAINLICKNFRDYWDRKMSLDTLIKNCDFDDRDMNNLIGLLNKEDAKEFYE